MSLNGSGRRYLPRGSRGDYPLDEGKHLIVVATWWAYGDESGIHAGSRYCSVLGYVGSARQWKMFRRDWRKALRGVPHFHAKDFFPPKKRTAKSSFYYGWSDKKVLNFLDRLLRTINRYDVRPIGFAYHVGDFMALSVSERRRLTGAIRNTRTRVRQGQVEVTDKLIGSGVPSEPYFLGFNYLITEALKASASTATVNYVFDRRRTREAWAFQVFDNIKTHDSNPLIKNMGMLAFDDLPDNEGLQAADLYAYSINGLVHGRVSSLLEHALTKLGYKRPVIHVGNADTFRAVLGDLDVKRQAGIDQAELLARLQREVRAEDRA